MRQRENNLYSARSVVYLPVWRLLIVMDDALAKNFWIMGKVYLMKVNNDRSYAGNVQHVKLLRQTKMDMFRVQN